LKIVADENIDLPIVVRLRSEGHEVLYIAELDPGTDDRTVLFRSGNAGAILLTADKDFGDLVYRQAQEHAGILLVRIAGLKPEEKADLVASAFARHGAELVSTFAVLSERVLRIRKPH